MRDYVLPMRVCGRTGHHLSSRLESRKDGKRIVTRCRYCNYTRIRKANDEEGR